MGEHIEKANRYKSCAYFRYRKDQILKEPEVRFPGYRFWSWILIERQETFLRFMLALFLLLFCFAVVIVVVVVCICFFVSFCIVTGKQIGRAHV